MRRIARIGLAVLIGLAVTEAGLRLARLQHPGLRRLLHDSSLPAGFRSISTLEELMRTTTLGWAPFQERDGYVLGSRSLPTPEHEVSKAPGTLRILALGDSFTFTRFPLDRHWTTLLVHDLEARSPGGRVELIRHGVPGTGPPFQLRLFELEGARLAPDLVILAFFVGNDFFDELGGTFPGGPADLVWRGLRAWSLTWRLGSNASRLASGLERARPPAATPPLPGSTAAAVAETSPRGGYEVPGFAQGFDESAPTFTENAFLDIEAERLTLCLRSEGIRFSARLDRVLETLDALREAVTASGARFAVVVIPDEYQVNPQVFADAARRAGRSPSDYDLDRPQAALVGELRAREVPVLDLLPASRRAAATESLYLPRNTHWSAAGNRLAAVELARFLVESGLVAGSRS